MSQWVVFYYIWDYFELIIWVYLHCAKITQLAAVAQRKYWIVYYSVTFLFYQISILLWSNILLWWIVDDCSRNPIKHNYEFTKPSSSVSLLALYCFKWMLDGVYKDKFQNFPKTKIKSFSFKGES